MLRVAVLRGGPSDEHDVSLKTGANVLANLQRDPYRPLDVFIDRQGAWHVRGIPMSPERALTGVDVAFNALHGQYGEDGTVQRILDRLGIRYTGAGALGSALAMNKALAKDALKNSGIKMARSVTLTVTDTLPDVIRDTFRTFPQPSVIKPASAGSSVGVTIARTFDEFAAGVKKAFQHSAHVLVEEYIKGKEATVGVIENLRGVKNYSLPAVEIIPPSENAFFDYDAKYGGASTERVPGNFSRKEAEELADAARKAHEALGLRHYSRSDFIVTPTGAYYLETNTLPGLTSESLLPKSLAAVGVTMPEFIDHLITLATN